MPEGTSLVLFKEELLPFKGKKIVQVSGIVPGIDVLRMEGRVIRTILTWGKHLLFYFGSDLSLRVHFQMSGTYYINKRQTSISQLRLTSEDGATLDLFTCSLKFIEQPLEDIYDWRTDVMSNEWDAGYVWALISRQPPQLLICDLLLDQNIFTGVGNIIKNEALYRAGIQPESTLGQLPAGKLGELIHETVVFSYDFYRWRKENKLGAHLQVYEHTYCLLHRIILTKAETGRKKRLSYWCLVCQHLY